MLAAIQGDALIEYGNANDKNRILIDGAPIGAYAPLTVNSKRCPGRQGSVLVINVDGSH